MLLLSGRQGCAHSTALLPLSTLTTCKPEGAQATALMEELQGETRRASSFQWLAEPSASHTADQHI